MVRCDEYFRSWVLSAFFIFFLILFSKNTFAEIGLSATVTDSSQDIYLMLSDFHGSLVNNQAVISNTFQFMEKSCYVKLFPGGTEQCHSHVQIELHVDGKFVGGMDKEISDVIFEHFQFNPQNHYKPECFLGCEENSIYDVDPASSDSSEGASEGASSHSEASSEPSSPKFIIACKKLLSVADLLKVPDRALFAIHPLCRGDLEVVHTDKETRLRWKVLKQDITRMKRGRATLRSPTALKACNAYLELTNKHNLFSDARPRVTYILHAQKGYFPYSQANFQYIQASGKAAALGFHLWDIWGERNPQFCSKEERSPEWPLYKTILDGCGDAMWVLFEMVLQQSPRKNIPASEVSVCSHRGLMASQSPLLEVTARDDSTLFYATLSNYKSIGPRSCAIADFVIDAKPCQLEVYPWGTDGYEEMLNVKIKAKEEEGRKYQQNSTASSSSARVTLTKRMFSNILGFIVYYQQPTARPDPKNWICKFSYIGSRQPAMQLFNTAMLESKQVRDNAQRANICSFIIQPINKLQIIPAMDSDPGENVSPFITTVTATSPRYIVNIARHELAMTRHHLVTLVGYSTDNNRYTILFRADGTQLYMEVQNIAAKHFRTATVDVSLSVSEPAVHWKRLNKPLKQGCVMVSSRGKYHFVILKLGSLSGIMKEASGANVTFSVVVNHNQDS